MLAEVIVKVAGMEKEERGKYYPRPSMAGPERCIRQMVYWATETPIDREMGDRFRMTIDDSSWHEELTADWIRKSAFQLHSVQMEVNPATLTFIKPKGTWICKVCGKEVPDNKLHGHIDGVITDMLLKDYHYEHKALNHFGFIRLWNGDYPFDYITQCCLYQSGLRKTNPEIDTTVLLIKNKSTAQYIEYLIHYDIIVDKATILSITHSNGQRKDNINFVIDDVCGSALDKFAAVDTHVKEGTLPERPFEAGTDFPCGYCAWGEHTCWSGYEKEVEALSDDAQLTEESETMCRYYMETNMHIRNMEKEKDDIKAKLKEALTAVGAKQARAGEYVVSRTVRTYSKLDKEKIPLNIIAQAEKSVVSETLTVRKPKKKEGK